MHYFFHDGRGLLTQTFTASTNATTVGYGGFPCGSTKLNKETGHNCRMTPKEFKNFGFFVFGLNTHSSIGLSKHLQGFRQMIYSFLNMLLCNFAIITNLHPVICHDMDHQYLACTLAQCTQLLLEQRHLPSLLSNMSGEKMTL